jgi:phosphopantothenate-cysteine ligase
MLSVRAGGGAEDSAGGKKYRFMVTSGGTREKIDEVRFITNMSTGELGSAVCEALAKLHSCEKIFYVCGSGAARPRPGKAEIIPVTDAASVTDAVKNILLNNRIDAVVHAMAVSDYRVKSVSTGSGIELERGQKISSSESGLVIVLESAPKIIPVFPALAPDALLVGFKLLCGAPDEELIEAAYGLLRKNNCAFVIANDKNFITETGHKAYLVDKNKNITLYNTKNEIADGIALKIDALLNGTPR